MFFMPAILWARSSYTNQQAFAHDQKPIKIIPTICLLPEQQCNMLCLPDPFFPHPHTKEKKRSKPKVKATLSKGARSNISLILGDTLVIQNVMSHLTSSSFKCRVTGGKKYTVFSKSFQHGSKIVVVKRSNCLRCLGINGIQISYKWVQHS